MATQTTKKVAAKKTAAKKPTKTAQNKGSLNVSFASEIPKISREGGARSSKYEEFLDKVKERALSNPEESVAVLKFPSQSKATGRYMSIRDAAKKREDAARWTVASRTHAEDDVRVYVQYNGEPSDA